jgi:hypothetical protein
MSRARTVSAARLASADEPTFRGRDWIEQQWEAAIRTEWKVLRNHVSPPKNPGFRSTGGYRSPMMDWTD